jgi:hypothetical protein
MSRLPHFLYRWLTDGCEVVSSTRRPPLTPGKILGTHFCKRLSRPQGHNAAGRIRSIEKSMTSAGININIDLEQRGCGGMEWIHMAQDRY